MDEWLWASAADLGRGIEAGNIDPLELTEAYLAAIETHQFSERIFARTTADRARSEAKAASDRAKVGLRRSPLDGVPISWKDLFDTTGIATEAGSRLLAGRVPDRDARVLQTATDAGLVCLGKTHMTELAFSGLGLNPMTQSPPCVNDTDAVSGGSSSGAATSVAFGMAAAGIGSDTGGSVRAPAAWNDLVGLKTAPGRLSLEGVVPLCARFDTVGPLCRTVEDAGLLLAAMEGGTAASLTGATLRGIKLAILKTSAFENLRDTPREAFQGAVERLTAAGASVEVIKLDCVAEAMGLAGVLFAPEAYGTWKTQIEANPDAMYPLVRERFRGGANISAADFVAAWQRLDTLRAEYAEATAGYDAVILPSVPILPPKQNAVKQDDDLFVSENLLTLQNTRIGNLMGLAGLTLPTGVPSCGILFQGPSEEKLLRIGAAAEAALA
ncbi:MAG: amidase [Boseongicola sp.]|nr:amidase [Boseongicola sp.]NNJ68129.1 amidase [Boseongicola sp.]